MRENSIFVTYEVELYMTVCKIKEVVLSYDRMTYNSMNERRCFFKALHLISESSEQIDSKSVLKIVLFLIY